MRVWLEGDKLQAHNLDATEVFRTLRLEHVEQPAGQLVSEKRELNVRVMGEARTPEEFRQMPLVNRNGQIVKLGDVAVVEDGLTDRRTFARFNRQPTVSIGVMRATGANVVQVCDEVKKRLPALRKMLPPSMEIGISTDYSLFIKDDIEEVKQAMLIGIALTAAVTFLFLGSIGTTLNVILSIPTSLIGTFMAMRWFGFTMNFMTLLALSLSVGVVVDDAILVLENIYRRREHGEGRRDAAVRGAREISFAAIAATFSIAAIFIPVAFLKGSIGKFFFQFGITVTVAVLLSLVISLTITPMLCAAFLNVRQLGRPRPRPWGGLFGPVLNALRWLHWLIDRWVLEPLLLRPMDWAMDRLSKGYGWFLRHALRHTWWVVPASVLLAASALIFVYGLTVPLPNWAAPWLGTKVLAVKPIGQELVPSEDQNRFIVSVICPVGSSIDYVDEMLAKSENALIGLKDPTTGREVCATLFAGTSIRPGQLVSEGIMFVRLIPADQRGWTQTDIMNALRAKLREIPGMRAVVLDLSTQGFTPGRGYPVNFAVQGPDWDTVKELSERVRLRLIDSGLVADVNSDYRPGMPEIRISPAKPMLADIGLPVSRLAFAVNVAVGGLRVGRFTEADKRYDVRVRYEWSERESPDQLRLIYVKNDKGQLVPLWQVADWQTKSTLPVINRYNHLRKVEITANMAPGVSQGEAIARVRQIAEEVRQEMELPPSYRFVQLGNAVAMQQTLDSLWWALALGFVVAYMILGVQFNSFVHPFTVLVAVPFGVTGALAMLWVAGDTLNLMSMIGMVLLAGLVKKNSIILVDYTNQLRAEGLGLREAVLTACPIRLRPILMTSFATIASAVPLALGFGPGAETRAPLARSIIGGIFLSTLVTLVVVPLLYILFDRFGQWIRRQARRDEVRASTGPEVNGEAGPPPATVAEPGGNGEAKPPVPRPRELEPVLEARPQAAT
jgi:HAE1 family hydrophobic/amphiphilic exporter-1